MFRGDHERDRCLASWRHWSLGTSGATVRSFDGTDLVNRHRTSVTIATYISRKITNRHRRQHSRENSSDADGAVNALRLWLWQTQTATPAFSWRWTIPLKYCHLPNAPKLRTKQNRNGNHRENHRLRSNSTSSTPADYHHPPDLHAKCGYNNRNDASPAKTSLGLRAEKRS